MAAILGKWMNQTTSSLDHVHGNAKEKNTLMYFKNNFPTDLKSVTKTLWAIVWISNEVTFVDNVDFSSFSRLMTNIYLEVSKSVFSHLTQYLTTSSVIWLRVRDFFFLYDTLFLSQLFKLIINCAIYHQWSFVPGFGCNTYVSIVIHALFYDYWRIKEW